MRIGNIDDLNNSNQSDGLIKLLQPENQKELTKSEKLKNWWHYRKWYVIVGIILFAAACSMIGNALGLFTKSPDLQIAYVGKAALPQDTVTALEQIFTSLAGDYNEDGEVIVQVNQYVSDSQTANPESAYYQYAAEVTLMADISEGESYFFLMDDPENFQQEYQVLALPDGSCPDQDDYSATDKVILWSDCALLSGAEAGSYTVEIAGQAITGSNQDILADLYLARRCFYSDKITDNRDECSILWDLLYNSQAKPAP